MYEKIDSHHKIGSSYLSDFICSYNDLKKVLGPHNAEGDGYKVTTEWVLQSPDGDVLTVYDWKCTVAYSPEDEEMFTEEDLRSDRDVVWHIGGRSLVAAERFHQYLRAKIKGEELPPQVDGRRSYL